MSGHSHYATIKRKKEAGDAAKGKLFSKLSKAISVAIKTGGGADPEKNYKLRMAIEQAKAANMPKSNIERVLSKAQETGDLEEMTYEGYGPDGVGVVVDVATDNRNRTAQEIKNIFERGGGTLAGPGAVSYNFEPRGLIVVDKKADIEGQMLEMIDLGVEDIEESDDGLEAYVSPEKAGDIKESLEGNGYKIKSFNLIRKPKNLVSVNDEDKTKKIIKFLDMLEDHDDVQNVYTNMDVPEDILDKIQ